MASQIRSRFRSILLLLQSRLVNTLAWDAARVIVTVLDADKVPHQMGDQDILIRPRNESCSRDLLEGGGRYTDFRTRKISLILRTRVYLDLSNADLIRLTDESLGHYALEDSVADILQTWLVVNDDDDAEAMPVRVLDLSDVRKDRGDDNWVSSEFTLEVDYLREHTLPEIDEEA